MPAATPLRLTAKAATRAIRARAKATGNVVLTFHAQDQMAARGITAPEVFRILREGTVQAPPQRTAEQEWKAEMEMYLPSGGDAVAVTVLRQAERLVVVTVMWRDGE